MKLRVAGLVCLSALMGAVCAPAYVYAADGVIPFSTYVAEQQNIMASLACKWVSMGGELGPSYGNKRYDFLCKGGTWATLSLYLDRSPTFDNGIGGVRLLYREWRDGSHTNGGEAMEAQKFLNYVVNRFVPARVGPQVMEAFWGRRTRSWTNSDVRVAYALESDNPTYYVHKLEISGRGSALIDTARMGAVPLTDATASQKAMQETTGEATSAESTSTGGGLLKPAPAAAREIELQPAPVPEPIKPQSVITNTPQPINLPRPDAAMPTPTGKPNGELVIPDNLPASAPANVTTPPVKMAPDALQPASPAELNTAPAPESLVKPVPPPVIVSNLLPDANSLINGRPRAPSNFDAYNRASELTKSVETRAQTVIQPGKVSPNPQAAPAAAAQKTLTAPSLPAVETPAVNKPAASAASGEGLGLQPGLPKAGATPVRPLPQLQFVPKAEPLPKADEVLQFEDEKSGI